MNYRVMLVCTAASLLISMLIQDTLYYSEVTSAVAVGETLTVENLNPLEFKP